MSLEKFTDILIKSLSGSVCHLTVVGVTAIALVGTNSHSSIAQTPKQVAQSIKNQQNINQVNLLFVHPNIGNDSTGKGTENAPWQTITQALANSNPNSVIMLASGTYSTNSGEAFPLILKPGVAIKGNIIDKGKSVIINGGGQYLSRSFGGQNVAIVANNKSSISGVTVINNNSRGYGLWIESNNSIVKENIFTQNTQDGIAVTGNGTANISNNYFYRNGANGITISGNARPEIRENIFQDTGFGVNIAQNAAPLVIGNKIQDNRSGIVVQANSTPILRNNFIQNNKEDGLVVIAQGRPDLGNSNDPGRNLFKSNKRYDINAKAAKLVIFAPGNNLASNRIQGKVNLSGINPAKGEFSLQQPIKTNPSVRQISQGKNKRKLNQLPSLPDSVKNINLQENLPQKNQFSPVENSEDNSGGIEFVAPQLNKVENGNNYQKLETFKTFPKSSASVRKSSNNPRVQNFQIYQNPYPVIRNNPRVQNFQTYQNPYPVVRNNPRVQNFQTYQTYQNPYPVIRNNPQVQNFQTYGIGGQIPRYRVLVLVNNQQQITLVSDLARDAFPRVWRGQQVIQIAVFSNSDNARSMIMNLANRGLQAVIEPVN